MRTRTSARVAFVSVGLLTAALIQVGCGGSSGGGGSGGATGSGGKGSGGSRRRLISNYTAHFLPPQSLFLARLPLHGAMFKRRLPTFCKDDSCRSRFPLQAANHGGDRNPGNEGDRPCRETTATPLVRTSLLFASLRHMEQYSRTFFPLFVRMIRNLLGYRSRERITRYLSKT